LTEMGERAEEVIQFEINIAEIINKNNLGKYHK